DGQICFSLRNAASWISGLAFAFGPCNTCRSIWMESASFGRTMLIIAASTSDKIAFSCSQRACAISAGNAIHVATQGRRSSFRALDEFLLTAVRIAIKADCTVSNGVADA